MQAIQADPKERDEYLELLAIAAGGLTAIIGPRFMPGLAQAFHCRRALLALRDPLGGSTVELFGVYFDGGELRRTRRSYVGEEPSARRLWQFACEVGDAPAAYDCRLQFADAVLGWLVLGDREAGYADTQEPHRLRIIGDQVALALDNWRLRSLLDHDQVNPLRAGAGKPSLSALRQLESWQRSLRDVLFGESGTKQIVETLGHLLKLPIILEDRDFRIIASSRDVGQTALSSDQLFHVTSDIGRLVSSTLLAKTNLDGLEVRRSLTPLMIGKDLLAYLTVVLPPGRELEPDEKIILRYAGVVLVVQLLREKVLVEERHRLTRLLIGEVCFNQRTDEDNAMDLANRLGVHLGEGTVVCVTELEGPCVRRVANDIVDLVRSCGDSRSVLAAAHGGTVAVLSMEPGAKERALTFAHEISSRMGATPETNWWTTVGPKCANVEEIHDSFVNCQGVNRVLRLLSRKNSFFDYGNLGVYGMLGIHPERFAWFAKKLLEPVLAYDCKNHTDLIETLKMYFANGQNIQATARSGWVAVGTVKYRLRRITEISGLDLGDPETALQIQLALKFL